MGLYHKYRPKNFARVVGQEEAVKTLKEFLDREAFPCFTLFTGPSGCGKTTLARICRDKLGCSDADFVEVNAADDRGIDLPRRIRRQAPLAPLGGRVRIWLIDEAHQLTTPAQNSFLKLLEETPKHVYFMLATTAPQDLEKTVITRATEIKLGLLPAKKIEFLVSQVVKVEKKELSEEVIGKIVDIADGSARKALVLLDQIIGMEKEDDQLDCLAKSDYKVEAIELCRLMMRQNVTWKDVAKILRGLDEEAEGIRKLVLDYMMKAVLNSGSSRAYLIMDAFRSPFYNRPNKPDLVMACWEAMHE